MKRVFPAPLLSLALCVLWLTLNLSVSPGNLLLGAILGFAAPLMMRKLRPKKCVFAVRERFCACFCSWAVTW